MLSDFEALDVLGEFKAKPKVKRPAPRKQKTLAAAREAYGIPMRSEKVVEAEIVQPRHIPIEQRNPLVKAIFISVIFVSCSAVGLFLLLQFFIGYNSYRTPRREEPTSTYIDREFRDPKDMTLEEMRTELQELETELENY